MATRGQKERIVDPKTIKNSFEWADAYKQGYKNIVLNENGNLTIVDSTKHRAIVKTIPHKSGYDSTVVLAKATNEELRALAEQTQHAIHQSLEENTTGKVRQYLEVEARMFETVEKWQSTEDSAVRRNLAFQVGKLMAILQKRDQATQDAKYPHRHFKYAACPRIALDYAAKEEGNTFVSQVVNQRTSANEREFTVADKA